MFATFLGDFEMARLLIRNGAAIDTVDYQGNTALMVASQHKQPLVAELLIANRASVSRKNYFAMDALTGAILSDDAKSASLLIKKDADVNRFYAIGMNPLELARTENADSVIPMLKQAGARRDLFPWFYQVNTSIRYQFSGKDSYWYLGMGLDDKKYHLSVQAGAGIRPKRRAVWQESPGNTVYQYQELRWYFTLDISKAVYFSRESGLGVRAGFAPTMSYGNYRGTKLKPAPTVALSPYAGLLYRGGNADVHFNYRYLDFEFENLSPHFFEIGVTFYFNRKKCRLPLKDFTYANPENNF